MSPASFSSYRFMVPQGAVGQLRMKLTDSGLEYGGQANSRRGWIRFHAGTDLEADNTLLRRVRLPRLA